MLIVDAFRYAKKNFNVDPKSDKSWFGSEKKRFWITISVSIILCIVFGIMICTNWNSMNTINDNKVIFCYGEALLVTFIFLLICEKNKDMFPPLVIFINLISWVVVFPFIVLRALIDRNSLEQKTGVRDAIIFEIILFIDSLLLLLLSYFIVSWAKDLNDFLCEKFSDFMTGSRVSVAYCFISLSLFKISLDVICILVNIVFRKIGLLKKKEEVWHNRSRLFEIYTSRVQLFLLVLVFIYATFNQDSLKGNESTIINVLTIFTLFILLSDKNKEWAPEIEELLN